jgi:hypothetical protein
LPARSRDALGIRLAQVREDDDLASKDTLATTRKYQYVWDIRYIDAPVLRDENTDEDDLCDDETLYYTTDANPGAPAERHLPYRHRRRCGLAEPKHVISPSCLTASESLSTQVPCGPCIRVGTRNCAIC